jgi:hypothetical protein
MVHGRDLKEKHSTRSAFLFLRYTAFPVLHRSPRRKTLAVSVILRSFGVPSPFLHIPLWAVRILALAMPVWGAWTGALTIFQVIWVFWVEAWLVIPFMLVRIATARGPYRPGIKGALQTLRDGTMPEHNPEEYVRPATPLERIRMMAGLVLLRGGVLLFYVLFIILFIFLQVTQKEATIAGVETMMFKNEWANGIWATFLFQHTLELITHFFYNGRWRTASPREAALFIDEKTILMHIMIVGTVFMHKFLFEGKDYAAKGEVVYVAVFSLLRLGVDGIAKKFRPVRTRNEDSVGVE